jgi:hypothetical protein
MDDIRSGSVVDFEIVQRETHKDKATTKEAVMEWKWK